MDSRPPPTLEDSIAAAQAWWRDAGVDQVFHDEPITWLADQAPGPELVPVAPRTEAPAAPPPPRVGGDAANWPADLSAFRTWWLTEPSLDTGGPHPRIPPRGQAGAALMLLVTMPEGEDVDSLLSGPQGRLLASFATAAGLAPEQLYVASALPRHTALPDWEELGAQGYGEILKHHVALVSPDRLIVFGTGVSPLLGHDPAQVAPSISELSIQSRKLPLLASYAPGRLLDHPRLRASLWQRWLEWTGGNG